MDDELWATVAAAISAGSASDPAGSARALSDCWAACGPSDHAARCVIAHYLADLQTELTDELMWDQRALDAHHHLVDEDLLTLGLASAAQMLPSLHLNLGDDWLRAGNVERAGEHLRLAREAEHVLGADPYGRMLHQGLDRLADRLAAQRGSQEDVCSRGGR